MVMHGREWVWVHTGLLLIWGVSIPAAFVFGWWESLPFIAFASIYANMATHWSAMQAARTERNQEKE